MTGRAVRIRERQREQRTITIPDNKLASAIAIVTRENRTGQLRINFSQGTQTGGVQWIENLPEGKRILAVD